MENYLDLIDDYLKEKNDLICFNSYSNDVRLFKNHIIKEIFDKKEILYKSISTVDDKAYNEYVKNFIS